MDAMQIIDAQAEIIQKQNDIISRIASQLLQHEAISREELCEIKKFTNHTKTSGGGEEYRCQK